MWTNSNSTILHRKYSVFNHNSELILTTCRLLRVFSSSFPSSSFSALSSAVYSPKNKRGSPTQHCSHSDTSGRYTDISINQMLRVDGWEAWISTGCFLTKKKGSSVWNLDQLSWTPLCMKPASWSQTGPAGQCRLLSYSAITAFLDRIPHTRLAMNLSRLCRWLALFMIRRYWGFFRWEGRRGRDCGEGGGGTKRGRYMSYYCFSRMPGDQLSTAEGFTVVLLTASSVVCLYNSLRFEIWSYCL